MVVPNSTGVPTTLTGTLGSGIGSGLHLEVTNGVPNDIGYFLAGNEATPGVVTGNGLLCLVGTGTSRVYRYSLSGGASNSIGRFDSAGVLQNIVGTSVTGSGFDVPNTIPATVPINIMVGDTWHFQVWHRDTPIGQGASNLSNGLSVTFPVPPTPIAGMVSLPSGTFEMGSDVADGVPYFGQSMSQPVHLVTLSSAFWMGEHEVTQSEYQAIMGTNPSWYSGANRPVERVSWNDARAYCVALTAQESGLGNVPAGYQYRLPTEAEWEYACRAGSTTEFSVGMELACADAQFDYNYHAASSCGSASTADVASYAPNAWGLYDMHGNVWEWCLDSYMGYSAGAVTDPFGTGSPYRIYRGGSWDYPSSSSRSAYRFIRSPGQSGSDIGFRIVLAKFIP